MKAQQSVILSSVNIDPNSKLNAFQSHTFQHPKNQNIPFICLTTNNTGYSTKVNSSNLCEIQSVNHSKYSSWFINQRVYSSSDILLVNKYDIRFLLLPYIEKNGTRYSPLDQIVKIDSNGSHSSSSGVQVSPTGATLSSESNVAYNSFQFLQSALNNKNSQPVNMSEICDVNDTAIEDTVLYRYNESKVLCWLTNKIHNIELVLAKKRISSQSSKNQLMSSNFNVISSINDKASAPAASTDTTSVEINRIDTFEAIQIISDYISSSTLKKLLVHLNLTETEVFTNSKQRQQHSSSSTGDDEGLSPSSNNKRKADWELELEVGRGNVSNIIVLYIVNNSLLSS